MESIFSDFGDSTRPQLHSIRSFVCINMSAALARFYKGDSAVADREQQIFRICNEKIGKILGWSNTGEDSVNELRLLSLSQGGLFNGAYECGWLCGARLVNLRD
jgi:hypothetical protein